MRWNWKRHGRQWKLEDRQGDEVLGSSGHTSYVECYSCGDELRGDKPETWLTSRGGNLDPDSVYGRLIASSADMHDCLVMLHQALTEGANPDIQHCKDILDHIQGCSDEGHAEEPGQ